MARIEDGSSMVPGLRTIWPYMLAGLLFGFLVVGCGTTETPPPHTDRPHGEAVRHISDRVENPSQLATEDPRLWVIAYGGNDVAWYYPGFPIGSIAATGDFQVDLPLEIGAANLQNLPSFCGPGVRSSDPEAAVVFVPMMVLYGVNQGIIQASSPTSLFHPSNGDILVFRLFSNRDVRIMGSCRGGLLFRAQVDLDLRTGWNIASAQIRGLPFTPTFDIWSGIPLEEVAWYVIGF